MNGSQIKFLGVFGTIIVALIVWMLYLSPRCNGDIGQLGAILFQQGDGDCWVGDSRCYPNENVVAYSNTIRMSKTDLVIIGDSFTVGKYSFVLCLSSLDTNLLVINVIRQVFSAPIQDCVSMLNKNMFIEGQTVILECVERELFERIQKMELDRADSIIFDVSNDTKKIPLKLGDFCSFLRLQAGIDNPILEYHLSKDLFSMTGHERKLYVYKDDMWYKSSEKAVREVVAGLIDLHNLALEKGVNLLLLVAADKYDCYEPWIVEEHSQNHLMDEIYSLPFVINTKSVLQKHIANGEKDVYKCNNTHWTNIGATIVAKHILENYLKESCSSTF